MQLKDLKEKILNGNLDSSVLIFKYTDNTYLCDTYVTAIIKKVNKQVLKINSLKDINEDNSFFEDDTDYLYILKTEKLEEEVDPLLENVIIVCKDLPKDLEVDYVEFPKLVNWQIEDYVRVRLPGLDDMQVNWLCNICSYNIYRLDQECKKLELFPKDAQKAVFKQLNNDNGYCDLNPLNIFNFINSIIKKDYKTVADVLKDLKYIDVEGTGVMTLMKRNIKNIIDIQMNPKATAQSLNMSPKQFAAIKYNVGKFTNDQLISIYDFLIGLDIRLKSGELQFKNGNRENNNSMVDYLTVNILSR